jgi:hypothetical protein
VAAPRGAPSAPRAFCASTCRGLPGPTPIAPSHAAIGTGPLWVDGSITVSSIAPVAVFTLTIGATWYHQVVSGGAPPGWSSENWLGMCRPPGTVDVAKTRSDAMPARVSIWAIICALA